MGGSKSKRIGSILVLALATTLLLGMLAPSASAHETRRTQMLDLMNAKREARGVADLKMSSRVARYSRLHSRRMARRGYIFHTASLSSRLKGIRWSIAGENVGAGGEVNDLFKAFMRSAPHRRNILRSSFHDVGIGMVRRNGFLWVTMVFYG